MYEWLVAEIAEVKEPKFHIVDGPANEELREAIRTTKLAAPKSYKQFALELGNCKLYRKDGDIDGYHIHVLASMREMENSKGEQWNRAGSAYFKTELLDSEQESPVFEYFSGPHGGYFLEMANGFEEWVKLKCGRAKKKYLKRRWKEILAGPVPFTEDERRIVEARKRFRWRVLGIADSGDIRFEVHNGSDTVIPYYSICISTCDGPFGGVFLDVSDVQPSNTCVIEKDCYKDLVPPNKIIASDYPPLGPEDRHRFWELRKDAPKRIK
ncbi:MAG: hypothetical protein WEH44_09235 [Pirellulaceae bacterium]